jgi:hypothetical protein
MIYAAAICTLALAVLGFDLGVLYQKHHPRVEPPQRQVIANVFCSMAQGSVVQPDLSIEVVVETAK